SRAAARRRYVVDRGFASALQSRSLRARKGVQPVARATSVLSRIAREGRLDRVRRRQRVADRRDRRRRARGPRSQRSAGGRVSLGHAHAPRGRSQRFGSAAHHGDPSLLARGSGAGGGGSVWLVAVLPITGTHLERPGLANRRATWTCPGAISTLAI